MNHRPHAAHANHATGLDGKQAVLESAPSTTLQADSEHVRILLEELDDVVFQAIRGDTHSLEQVQQLWPRVVREIGWELVEESREQYLRYALDLTRQQANDRHHRPEHALAALEVIELLTGE